MTIPVAGDRIFRCVFDHLWHGNAAQVVIHVRSDDATAVLTAEDVAVDLMPTWVAQFLQNQPSNFAGNEVVVTQVWPVPLAPYFLAMTGMNSIAGEGVPNQVAMVVTHRSLSAGIRARGRSYMPGGREDQFDGASNGRWAAATVTAMQNKWDAFESAAALQGEFLTIWSTRSTEAVTPQYYDMDSHTARAIPAVQRRRRIGQGI